MQVREVGHRRRSSLALPARAIQRKRIHSLSTSPRPLALARGLLVVAAAGCSSRMRREPAGAVHPRAAVNVPCFRSARTRRRTLHLPPQARRPAGRRADNFLRHRRLVHRAPQGATVARLGVAAARRDGLRQRPAPGSADFRVQAQRAPAGDGDGHRRTAGHRNRAGGAIPARLEPVARPRDYVRGPVLRLGHPAPTSTSISRPSRARAPVTLSMLGETARFDFVESGVVSAAVGRGDHAEGTGGTGCVDMPGSSLLSNGAVEVGAAVTDAVPDPVGTTRSRRR